MSCEQLVADEQLFLRHFVQNSPQLAWFLGAGTSRSSGLPAAQDLVWDLKRRYYCAKENQDVQAHNINNRAIRAKIQGYFDTRGCPEEWSAEEYSHYFELVFGDDYSAQKSYLQEQLSPERVTLTVGPRALAGLMAMGRTRVVFSTNFDNVVEDAHAYVTGKNLTAFHLEGSYAALEALDGERFPMYAKLHGDFRYHSIKNLAKDLLVNDEAIQKCFVAAAGRYGLVVAGYSGRDANVMSMLDAALSQPNPFPHGIWWTVPSTRHVAPSVIEFIEAARSRNVDAHIVDGGTFDVMLHKLWRQCPDKPSDLDQTVRSARSRSVSIPVPKPGNRYPILRTNALEIACAPTRCGKFPANGATAADVFAAARDKQPNAVVSYDDGVLFWGDAAEARAVVKGVAERDVATIEFDDPADAVARSTYVKSFFETGLAEAVCCDKPLFIRKKGSTCYAVVDHRQDSDSSLAALRSAVGSRGPGAICGAVPGLKGVYWAEAARLRLEERSGALRLLIEPDIWIKPLSAREQTATFLRTRKLKRYNPQAYNILNAWINILLGEVGHGTPVEVSYGADSEFPATFTVSTRTAFSRRGTA